jgi:tetratricopeptide (TPR) repeat protein
MTAVIIWFLAVVGLVLAGLSTRAFLLEKREGLPRSSLRCALSIAIALGIVAMGVYTQVAAHAGAPATTAEKSTPTPHDKATQATIDALKKEVRDLSDQLAKKQAELEKLDPTEAPPEEPGAPSQWPLMIAISLVLFAFGALALGDLQTLIPRKRTEAPEPEAADQTPGAPAALDKPEPASLPALAAHANAGRYKAALAMAVRMSVEQLHKLEVLDFLYLRAFCNVMAVAAPEDGTQVTHQDRTDKLAAAQKDLASMLELAPHSAEAQWLSGYVKARAGEWQAALDTMRAAKAGLDANNASEVNESVCLLMLAEAKLAAADTEGATKLFDEVTQLGVLAGQIPVALVTHRVLTVRTHIKDGKFAEAADGIARIRAVEGLDEKAQRATTVACDVYDVAIHYRSGELDKALAATRAFMGRWLPAQLPDVEDQAADEFLLPAIDKATLQLPADLYRGLFFLEAVVRVDLASRRGQALPPDEVDAIATALLRALQFQPRHRESLAALGALYLAYKKDRTEKALSWLDAALTMGVRSPRARALLAEARRVEQERKELLQMFRSASAKFLSDPAVGVAVRKALIEELGRFDEFRPVVLDLQEAGALEAAPSGEITVTALRERAAFVGGIASEVVRRAEPAAVQKLTEIHRELTSLANNVETSSTRIAALERQVMEQLGRIVLR